MRRALAVGMLLAMSARVEAQEPLRVAVTLPDLAPIVEAIGGAAVECTSVMPGGSDPHSFHVTRSTVERLQAADLIVYANSSFLHFEGRIKRQLPDKPCLDWADYEAHGAKLRAFPGYTANPHGFWLDLDNGLAIARAVAEEFERRNVDGKSVAGNLAQFETEITALRQAGHDLAQENVVAGSAMVAAVPGVAYVISNVDMKVGAVLLREGAGFASGRQLHEIVQRLSTGEYAGVVCPLSMREAKPGEMARLVAEQSGCRVYYVKFLPSSQGPRSYLSQAYYNAAVLTSATASAHQGATVGTPFICWGVLGTLVLLAVILAQRLALYRARCALARETKGAGIFSDMHR